MSDESDSFGTLYVACVLLAVLLGIVVMAWPG